MIFGLDSAAVQKEVASGERADWAAYSYKYRCECSHVNS